MNAPARWALSPLVYRAHLLLPEDGPPPSGVLKARCGHLLPTMAAVHDQLPARRCPPCELNFYADVDNPPKFSRHGELPPMLTAEELVDWVALSRVHAGAVVRYRGEYLDGGQPMPQYLIPELLFDVLVRVGLLSIGAPDQLGLKPCH